MSGKGERDGVQRKGCGQTWATETMLAHVEDRKSENMWKYILSPQISIKQWIRSGAAVRKNLFRSEHKKGLYFEKSSLLSNEVSNACWRDGTFLLPRTRVVDSINTREDILQILILVSCRADWNTVTGETAVRPNFVSTIKDTTVLRLTLMCMSKADMICIYESTLHACAKRA